ncbi:MAG: aldehyde dehydrogenase family protein [Myxococcaceae bacterium]
MQVTQTASARSMTDPDLIALVAKLRRSFDSGITRSYEWRRHQLERFKAMLEENEAEWLAALHADLGKPTFEAWGSDFRIVLGSLEGALKNLSDWMKPRKVSAPIVVQPATARIMPEPLGVALVIGAWNYPLQLGLEPVVGAIAAGNCVIAKPSEVAVATSTLIATLIPKYLDPECTAVVQGGVPETTTLLTQRFDHIFYTGNGNVGRVVMTAAAKHLTPVTLELGGKSPCIVDDQVDLETAAHRIVFGKFFNAGQTCVAPDYVLAVAPIEAALLGRIASVIREFYGDDPKQSPSFARIINDRHLQRLSKLLDSGEKVVGGEVDAATRYIAPTVLRNVDPGSPVMSEEIFGPILPVLTVPDLDSAIAFVNARPKPLALYVYSREGEHVRRVLERTSSGGACVNDCLSHLIPENLPFGGVGDSGMGAYHGQASFDTFTHYKSVLDRPTYLDPKLRYPPYDEKKLKWGKRLA